MTGTPRSGRRPGAPGDRPRVDGAGALEMLREHASAETLAQMGPRYGIHADRALGVPMAAMKRVARELGRDHALAAELWSTGIYEARTVAALVEEPELVTIEQMDRWCADFDNWALCDTVCFSLFDRAPQAWTRLQPWARDDREFVRRAAFALLWSLALHDGAAADAQFVGGLALVEQTRRTNGRSSRSRCRCRCVLSGAGARSFGMRSAPPPSDLPRVTPPRPDGSGGPPCGRCRDPLKRRAVVLRSDCEPAERTT